MTIALFPGQGVQAAGMDGGLGELAVDVFATASHVLGEDVLELCRTGRSGTASLDSTLWAQPAVLTCSVAAFRGLSARGESYAAVAGHSVGEYAALVAGSALDLADALQLIALRAQATDDAAHQNPGGMVAVMRIDREAVEQICERAGTFLAADNSAGQLVMSGPHEALESARAAAEGAGATCRSLDVAGAFHSPAMEPAIARLEAGLAHVTFRVPRIDVWSSTTAAPVRESDEIREVLLAQLVSPVRWRETVEGLAGRNPAVFADLGPGRVVGALAKRIVRGAEIKFVTDLLPASASAS
ncbi:MAG: ACP S-malonyltransferase [Actinomycetota bacterium]